MRQRVHIFTGKLPLFYAAALVLASLAAAMTGCLNHSPTTATPVARSSAEGSINYFLAVRKWNEMEQSRRVSETIDKREAIASVRAMLKETRQAVFDQPDLQSDFREAYLKVIGCQDEAVSLLEQFPNVEDPAAMLGFGLQAIWAYVFKAGDPLKELKERAARLNTEARQAASNLDAIAVRHGARTDWEAMPRVAEVIPNSFAAKLGVKKEDFLFSYDGTKLFNRLHFGVLEQARAEGKQRAEVRFLTPRGILTGTIDVGQLMGIKLDTTCAQPPILVRLQPYALFSGYYVRVLNASPDKAMENVVVRYTNGLGLTREQRIGSVGANTLEVVDPDKVGWRIAKGQTISVNAQGYAERSFSTDRMIK